MEFGVLEDRVQLLQLDPGALRREPPADLGLRAGAVALPGPTSSRNTATSSMRRSRHCPESTLSSVSAMFNQLPCLGVSWTSSRSHSRLASAAGNASYSAPPVWVFRLSQTRTRRSASG